MWKRCIFSLFGIALLVVALFPLEIFLKVVEVKAKSDFKKRFGAEFTFEKIFWHEGKVHFINASICRGETLKAFFSEATFAPHFDLLKREIGGTLLISRPVIEHQKERLLPAFSAKKNHFPFINLCLKLQVEEGLLLFEESNIPIGLNFQQQILGEKIVGRIVLEWQTKPFETFFSYENGLLEMATHFREHRVEKISEMLLYFFGEQIPFHFTDWKVIDGRIDGRLAARFDCGNCTYLQGALHLWDVQAKNESLALCGNFGSCDAKFDIETARAKQWNGEFALQGGNLTLEEEYWQGLWDIDSLHSMICVKNGQVESSILRGNFMGMEGEIDLNWHSPTTLMRLAFSGYSKEMGSIVPEKFKRGFSKSFPDDYFELDATVSRHLEGLELKGKLHFEERSLDFGCQFGGEVDHHVDFFSEPLPPSAFIDQLKSQFCLSKRRLGWFEAKEFPLEKFLAPYLFGDVVPLTLSGDVSVKGSFDERYLVMFYEGNHISLEGPNFCLAANAISEQGEMMAVHYIDLKTWDHVGYLPLKGAKHFQKNHSIHLEDVEGLVQFDNKTIRINDLKSNWQGLLMKGQLEIQINSLSDMNLALCSSIPQGNIMVGSRLLSHFVNTPLTSLPLLGTFSSDELNFQFHNGILVGGSLKGECNFEMEPLYQSQATFSYDCHEKHLKISDASGVLKVREHLLDFACPSLSFLPKMVEMKLALREKEREIFDVSASFDKVKNALSVNGEDLSIQGFGEKEDYHFPKMTFGNWVATCKATKEPSKLLIDSFQLTHPEKGEFEFQGEFDQQKKELKGTIDSIDIDLAPLFGKTLWAPKGRLSGRGELEWSWNNCYAVLQASSTGLEFGNIPFDDENDLSLTFSSSQGIFVEGLALMGAYQLETLHYDPTLQKVILEDFHFSLTPDKLPWVFEVASTLFPGKFYPSFFEVIHHLKESEPLEGSLSVEVKPETIWLTLYLNDGSYYFLDREWNLKDFVLAYSPQELFIRTHSDFRGNEYALFLKTESSSMQQGTLAISDETDLMRAEWRRLPKGGWSVDKVEGSISGVDAHLLSKGEETSDSITFDGYIQLDPNQLGHLLPTTLQDLKTRFDFGGIYLLDGAFSFSKEDFKNYTFYGELTGQDCSFNKVELALLTASCDFSRDFLEFSNVAVKDWSGRLYLDHATLLLRDSFPFTLSHLAIQDFRLSRLSSEWTRRERGDRPLFRSIFVPTFELNGFQGDLFNKCSYLGDGGLRFTNYPKRTLFSNLMMLPTEVTARIGLDPTAFIPASGNISYRIEDGKVQILDFDEMYSDGKRSRFFLADHAQSYINLEDGSVNMNIKMKQYNLLMKIAELFTLSVKGPLLHPSYVFTSSD